MANQKSLKGKKSALDANALLELAKSSLEIDDIILRGTNLHLDDEHEPGINAENKNYGVQHATQPLGYKIEQVDGQPVLIVRHGFGVRFIDPENSDLSEEAEEEKVKIWVKLEGVYSAKYILKEGKDMPSDDVLKAFAEINAPFNLWPFWREQAHMLTQKSGMTGFVMPLYFCASNP